MIILLIVLFVRIHIDRNAALRPLSVLLYLCFHQAHTFLYLQLEHLHFIAMRDLFRETVFGRSIHFISGGAAFSPSDKAALTEEDVTDQEKGQDSELVDWVEDDPEVLLYSS